MDRRPSADFVSAREKRRRNMVDVARIAQVILVIDGEEWVLKKKSSILNFCYDYLDYVDSSIRSEPTLTRQSSKKSAPKKKPKSILKPESKPKKKSKPPPSSEESDEQSEESFDVETSEEEPPKKGRSKKKKKELKPGYAKMNISYAETKGDIMKAAKEMARSVKFES